MRGRFLLALISLLLIPGCEKAKLREKEPAPEPIVEEGIKFPFFRKLTDSRGREIEAEVLGRDQNTVTIIRWSDKARFTLPLKSLSPYDQTFLLKLPPTEPRPPEPEGNVQHQRDSTRKKRPSETKLTGYAQIIQGRINDIEKEIEGIKEEASEIETGTIRHRTLLKRREKLEEEIGELRLEFGSIRK